MDVGFLRTTFLKRLLRSPFPVNKSGLFSSSILCSRKYMGYRSKSNKIMRGIIAERTGGPEVLSYSTDLQVPVPKRGEVLVRNFYAGVNYIDIYFRTGAYPSQKPEILGREAVGEIIETGEGELYGLQKGDRVVFIGPKAYAEYTAVNALHVYKVPAGIPDNVAVSSVMQGLAALTLTKEACNVEKGQWALVHAAAGGVGQWLCQLLSRRGVHVIGTASTDKKRDIARISGAAHVLDYNDPGIVSKIQELTGGLGVDVIFDGVGNSTFNLDLATVRRKGTVVIFGTPSSTPEVQLSQLTPKNLRLLKPTFMSYIITRSEFEYYMKQLFELLATKSIQVRIYKEYELKDAVQAQKDLENRETTGKLLLKL